MTLQPQNVESVPGRRGILFIISAPSGTGKTTLVKALTGADGNLMVSVSHTTRAQRPGETHGTSYYFVSEQEFQAMADTGQFLEHARVFDFHYGTSKAWVNDQLDRGIDVILEIDWQGARQVRGAIEAVAVFILPPDMKTLASRLAARGESRETIARRMHDAHSELSHYREYDYLVVNDDKSTALADLAAVIRAARCRYSLQCRSLDARVEAMLRSPLDIN